jgi:hypothetical protein
LNISPSIASTGIFYYEADSRGQFEPLCLNGLDVAVIELTDTLVASIFHGSFGWLQPTTDGTRQIDWRVDTKVKAVVALQCLWGVHQASRQDRCVVENLFISDMGWEPIPGKERVHFWFG